MNLWWNFITPSEDVFFCKECVPCIFKFKFSTSNIFIVFQFSHSVDRATNALHLHILTCKPIFSRRHTKNRESDSEFENSRRSHYTCRCSEWRSKFTHSVPLLHWQSKNWLRVDWFWQNIMNRLSQRTNNNCVTCVTVVLPTKGA